VMRQVKMKEAPASVGFSMIRADLEEDSDVEVSESRYVDAFGARADIQRGKRPVARPAVTDSVKDDRARATKQTAQKQTEGSKTCRQQVQQAETGRQEVASDTQTGRQGVASEAQTKQGQTGRQEVASEEKTRRQRVAQEEQAGRQGVALEASDTQTERQGVALKGSKTGGQQVQLEETGPQRVASDTKTKQGQTGRQEVAQERQTRRQGQLEDTERSESSDEEDWWRIDRMGRKRSNQSLPYHAHGTAKSRIGLAPKGLSDLNVRQAKGAQVFRPLPWSAYASEEVKSRFSRKSDVGRVDTSCFGRVFIPARV
jgi:hypothetical protein